MVGEVAMNQAIMQLVLTCVRFNISRSRHVAVVSLLFSLNWRGWGFTCTSDIAAATDLLISMSTGSYQKCQQMTSTTLYHLSLQPIRSNATHPPRVRLLPRPRVLGRSICKFHDLVLPCIHSVSSSSCQGQPPAIECSACVTKKISFLHHTRHNTITKTFIPPPIFGTTNLSSVCTLFSEGYIGRPICIGLDGPDDRNGVKAKPKPRCALKAISPHLSAACSAEIFAI